ncbi:MAG: hypothetical protein IIT37_05085, partial [Bacteroidales bacterium]|nr:hypothetical protein [Bacteroidales bacterium]
MKRIVTLLTIIILMLPMWGKAQINTLGEPVINTFPISQTWGAIQDQRGIMYFANYKGVAVFDGVNWSTIQLQSNAPVKSFAIDTAEHKIYVGAKGDFGVLVNNKVNAYEFESLTDKVAKENTVSDIYKIIISEKEGVVFASQM